MPAGSFGTVRGGPQTGSGFVWYYITWDSGLYGYSVADSLIPLSAVTGSLSGQQAAAASSYNLTTLGTADWAHWGRGGGPGNFDHKATGGSQISNVTALGSGASYGGWSDTFRNATWTDGTPAASDTNEHGYLWANGALGAGYSFTVPADTTARTLFVYAGGFSSGSTLTAHLSDGSAADYVVNASSSGLYSNLYTISYKAASAGQKLTLSYVRTTNINGTGGSADLIAAALAGASGIIKPVVSSVIPTLVTPFKSAQLTINGTGFQVGAAVTLTDPFGVVRSTQITARTATQIVLFTPDLNAGGTWKVDVKNPDGGDTGQFAFTMAVVSPIITSVSPSPVTASSTAQSFTINGTGFQSGAAVTLTDSSGVVHSETARVTSLSTTQIVLSTSDLSVTGSWKVDVKNADGGDSGLYGFGIVPSKPIGSLSGQHAAAASSYNLTALGTADWAHWGRSGVTGNFDHKATGGSQISNVTTLGSGASYGGWSDASRNATWTDGTPAAADTNEHGYLWANSAVGAGYSFTVPADTTTRTLYVYAGGFSSGSTLTAHLSDGSAADYVVSASSTSLYTNLYTITYKAASAGQKLTISYVRTTNINGTSGSADLIAAALA